MSILGIRKCAALAGCGIALALSGAASAEEGGGSAYVPGTFNDFAAGVIGPAGIYLRNDITFYEASIGVRPLGGVVDAGIDEVLMLNLVKIAFVSKAKFLGGTATLGVVVPVIPVVDVDARLGGPGFTTLRTGSSGGFGDVFLLPAINWTAGNHHFQVGLGVNVPVGKYSRDRAVNLSRNYWAYDPQVTYTYLEPASGFDLSVTAGVMINGRNKETNYRSGTAVHADATMAKHFASGLAIGVTGYWYQQVEDDDGLASPLLPSGFRGSAAGIGPAASYSFTSGKGQFSLTAKWLHDVEATNRLRGDTVMFSLATKL